MRIVRHAIWSREVVDSESATGSVQARTMKTDDILLFQLTHFRLELVQVCVGLALGMCEGFLDHEELVQLMGDIKVSLLHLCVASTEAQ